MPGALMDKAKGIVERKIGIPAQRILISATHSHSTPSVCSLLGSGQNDDYAEYLSKRIAEGIELANGYNGYLPSPEQFELGGYTTWRARSSYLEVEAEPKIRKAVLDLLHRVALMKPH